MSRTLSIIGILVTALYLIGAAYFFDGRLAEIKALPPNNIGDFLAGVFGPLAILWLILGFFQQGIELRQNTRALELQAEELRHSVDQQKQMVEVSRKQMEAELEAIQFERRRLRESAQPKFVFHGTGATISGGRARYSSAIKNFGSVTTDVLFSFEPPTKNPSITKVFSWSPGEEKRLEWEYETGFAEVTTLLTISYVDGQGFSGQQVFEFVPAQRGDFVMVEITKL